MTYPKSIGLTRYNASSNDASIPGPGAPVPSTVLIVGSGAIVNSWEPVISTIRQIVDPSRSGGPAYDLARFSGHELARLSFFHRLYRNAVIKDPTKMKRAELIKLLDYYTKFRLALAQSFTKFEDDGEIRLRDSFELVNSHIDPNIDGIITINWDQLLWKEKNRFPNLIQLHGRVTIPESLILPTETAAEEDILNSLTPLQYARIQGHKDIDEKTDGEFIRQWQRRDSIHELLIAHSTAMKWLAGANKVLFFGVGFNLYDNELNSVFGGASEGTALDEVVVFDVDEQKRCLASRFTFCPMDKVTFIHT